MKLIAFPNIPSHLYSNVPLGSRKQKKEKENEKKNRKKKWKEGRIEKSQNENIFKISNIILWVNYLIYLDDSDFYIWWSLPEGKLTSAQWNW